VDLLKGRAKAENWPTREQEAQAMQLMAAR
jgi:hypothetical protein